MQPNEIKEKVIELHKDGKTIAQIVPVVKLSKSTIHTIIKEYKAHGNADNVPDDVIAAETAADNKAKKESTAKAAPSKEDKKTNTKSENSITQPEGNVKQMTISESAYTDVCIAVALQAKEAIRQRAAKVSKINNLYKLIAETESAVSELNVTYKNLTDFLNENGCTDTAAEIEHFAETWSGDDWIEVSEI